MQIKRHILIGTAGHVDHGKTTLISALTGGSQAVLHALDRLAEEKKRGITIDLGYAFLPLPDGGVASMIDVPGHEKFVKNMLAGAGGIDLVLLVIASDDGVMPQTREHLHILHLLNARGGIIVLTKCDATDKDWREMVRDDIREAVADTFLADAPIIEVSAVQGIGIDTLREAIFAKIADAQENKTPDEATARFFRVPIDRVFSVDGFGTVVTGTLAEGTLRVGDAVEIMPAGKAAKVRTLQVHGGEAQEAFAGQRVAVNVSGVARDDAARGAVLSAPGTIMPTRMLDVRLQVLADAKWPVRNGSRVHFHYGTASALCKVVLIGRAELAPGEAAFAQLRFAEDVAVKENDRFVIRFYSPMETVGGGTVLHIAPKKHRQGRAEATAQALTARAQVGESGDMHDRIHQAIADASPHPPLAEIAKRLAYTQVDFDAAVLALVGNGKLVSIGSTHAIDAASHAQLLKRINKLLTDFHEAKPLQPGMRQEELRSRILPDSKPAYFDALLDTYNDALRLANGYVALPQFSIQYNPTQEAIRADILQRLAADLFSPPAPEALAAPHAKKAADFQAVLDAMQTEGTLVTTEAGILFLATTVQTAKDTFAQLAQADNAVTLAAFRDALQTSRKYALSLLEYFDRINYTRKNGDARSLR
ncbi:MAG: selenocysteine-specific translation elongation factor [Defluviitaleaceae bacterium]|nr:selenocysteine-specific translation elongation factor [Defluviitaleaceae bacterium]